MNTPPLPQPHQFTCAQCGFGWDKVSAFCPRCGAAQASEPRPNYRLRTLIQVTLGTACALAGAAGGCAALLGLSGSGWEISLLGGVLLAIAVFLFWLSVRYGK